MATVSVSDSSKNVEVYFHSLVEAGGNVEISQSVSTEVMEEVIPSDNLTSRVSKETTSSVSSDNNRHIIVDDVIVSSTQNDVLRTYGSTDSAEKAISHAPVSVEVVKHVDFKAPASSESFENIAAKHSSLKSALCEKKVVKTEKRVDKLANHRVVKRLRIVAKLSCLKTAARKKKFVKTEQKVEKLDNHRVVKCLGSGAFGQVYLLEPPKGKTGKQVAVKSIPKVCPGSGRETDIETVRREVSIMESLNHPNLIGQARFLQGTQHFNISMRYCPNGDMRSRMLGGDLSVEEFEKYTVQLTCAVRYLHNRCIFHGDIKLKNMLLDEGNNLVLADFGQSHRLDADTVDPPFIGGTPPYLPPEVQLDGYIDAYKIDSYAVGVSIWYFGFNLDVYEYVHMNFLSILWMMIPTDCYVRYFLTGLLEDTAQHRWSMNMLWDFFSTIPSLTHRVAILSQF